MKHDAPDSVWPYSGWRGFKSVWSSKLNLGPEYQKVLFQIVCLDYAWFTSLFHTLSSYITDTDVSIFKFLWLVSFDIYNKFLFFNLMWLLIRPCLLIFIIYTRLFDSQYESLTHFWHVWVIFLCGRTWNPLFLIIRLFCF